MRQSVFNKKVEEFRANSQKHKTITSFLLISANTTKFCARIHGYPRQISGSLVKVLVDNPSLIRVMDGACRHARKILKEKAIFNNEGNT